MKILITGGAGFIGTHIINQLQSTDIIVLDNFLEQVHGSNPILIDGVEYIKGDVSNIKDIQKKINEQLDKVQGRVFYRKDIGSFNIGSFNIDKYSEAGVNIDLGNKIVKEI